MPGTFVSLQRREIFFFQYSFQRESCRRGSYFSHDTIDIKLNFFRSFNIKFRLPCTHPSYLPIVPSLLVVYRDVMRRNRKRAVYLRFAHVRRESIDVTFASPSILAHLQRCDDVNQVYAKSASMSSMRCRYTEDNVVVIVDLPEKSVVDPSLASSRLANSDRFICRCVKLERNATLLITLYYVREERVYQRRKRWYSEQLWKLVRCFVYCNFEFSTSTAISR